MFRKGNLTSTVLRGLIVNCNKLKVLFFTNTAISDITGLNLEKLPNLRFFSTSSDIKIKSFSLKELDIRGCKTVEVDCPNLEILRISSGTRGTESAAQIERFCPKVKTIANNEVFIYFFEFQQHPLQFSFDSMRDLPAIVSSALGFMKEEQHYKMVAKYLNQFHC